MAHLLQVCDRNPYLLYVVIRQEGAGRPVGGPAPSPGGEEEKKRCGSPAPPRGGGGAGAPAAIGEWLDSHAHWGPSTKHVAVTSLRAFFAWAVGRASSPAHLVALPRRPIRPQRTLSADQAEKLLGSLDTSRRKGIRDLALIALLLDTGLRSSEICRLELIHVELERRTFQALTKGNRWERGVFSEYTRSVAERRLAARPGG